MPHSALTVVLTITVTMHEVTRDTDVVSPGEVQSLLRVGASSGLVELERVQQALRVAVICGQVELVQSGGVVGDSGDPGAA